MQRIDQLYAGGGRAGYLLYADGRRFSLELERDESLASPHFSTAGLGQRLAGGRRRRCLYRGTVDGSPQSLAVFSLCGGLDGFFAVKHAHYTVRPLSRAAENGIYGDRSEPVLHVFSKERFSFQTVPPPRESCGTPGQRSNATSADPSPVPASGRRSRRSVSKRSKAVG